MKKWGLVIKCFCLFVCFTWVKTHNLHLEKQSFHFFSIDLFFVSTIFWGQYQANSCGPFLSATWDPMGMGEFQGFAALGGVTLVGFFMLHCSFSMIIPWVLIPYCNNPFWFYPKCRKFNKLLILPHFHCHVNHSNSSKREAELCIRYDFILCIYKAKHKF